MSVLIPRLTAGLVDRWFERVLTPPAEPGARWPLSVDLALSTPERELLRAAADRLRRVVGRSEGAAPAGLEPAGRRPDPPTDPVTGRVGAFLAAASAAIDDTRRTLGLLAGGELDGGSGAAGPGVDEDALAVAAGINAGAAALARDSVDGGGPARRPTGAGFGEPTAAEAARRAGEAAAEAAVGGADLSAVAGRAAAAMLAGWGAAGPDGPGSADGDRRARAVVGRLLVGLQDVTRPPDPPAAPAPCGAGPGDVLGRAFLAEITCETAVPASQVASLRSELQDLAELVRLWPRSASEPRDGGWQRVHVHTDRPGAVIEALYACGSVFDLQVTTLD